MEMCGLWRNHNRKSFRIELCQAKACLLTFSNVAILKNYVNSTFVTKTMNLEPKRSDTNKISENIWKVGSFEGLLEELNQISEYGVKTDSVMFYRGHRDDRWLLDSTFMRSFKTTLFGIQPHERLTTKITDSKELHLSILNLFLLKFGVLSRPSDELETKSVELELDPWFEFIKRTQQHPEEDQFFLKGTNMIDWSESSDVALFFANGQRDNDGALFVCDATATGNTHQKRPLGEILDIMDREGNWGSSLGIPLLIQPLRNLAYPRPKNQQAVYFAQMDMRYDLETIWKQYSLENGGDRIILKIILPPHTISEIDAYLSEKGIDDKFIYPDL